MKAPWVKRLGVRLVCEVLRGREELITDVIGRN